MHLGAAKTGTRRKIQGCWAVHTVAATNSLLLAGYALGLCAVLVGPLPATTQQMIDYLLSKYVVGNNGDGVTGNDNDDLDDNGATGDVNNNNQDGATDDKVDDNDVDGVMNNDINDDCDSATGNGNDDNNDATDNNVDDDGDGATDDDVDNEDGDRMTDGDRTTDDDVDDDGYGMTDDVIDDNWNGTTDSHHRLDTCGGYAMKGDARQRHTTTGNATTSRQTRCKWEERCQRTRGDRASIGRGCTLRGGGRVERMRGGGIDLPTRNGSP